MQALTKGISSPYATSGQGQGSLPLPYVESKPTSANENLPELRSTYHDSFGGSGGFMGPAYKRRNVHQQVQHVSPVAAPSPRSAPADMSRYNDLEDRLTNQERASQQLLERAMRIKEDVVDNLNLTHSTWQGEKKQRELLQEHIRSITELVKKLDRDIKALEEQIRVKDSYISSSGNAIKSIELQQATAVTDMRGRIARCDAAISKLANEHSTFQDSLKQTGTRHQDSIQRLQEKIQALEIKIAESAQKLERSNTESLLRTQTKEGDMAKNTAVVETKLKGSIEEVKMLITNQRHVNDTEREKAIGRLTLDIEKRDVISKERLGKLEQKVDRALSDLNKELKDLRSLSSVKDMQKKQQEMEQRIAAMVEASLREQAEKFSRLRNDCRQGFASVHDSITNSKSVLEGKLTLSEEQLRKEISHVKNMIVLV